jgi:hypothetical protein
MLQRAHDTARRPETDHLGDGWVKQTTHDEPRLSEVVQAYRELGREVHLEPWAPGTGPACCSVCLDAQPGRYFTVFTRLSTDGATTED